MYTEQTVAKHLTEPPNGTKLVIQNSDTDFRVIWRDDAEADRWGGEFDTERWFEEEHSCPMELYQYVKYAEAVWTLSAQPLTVFHD